MTSAEWSAFAIALMVMVIGTLGTVLPALPGLPLIWLAMLVYGIVEGFESITVTFLGLALAVVIVAEVADYFARAWGARRFGASRAGAVGAVVGSLVGLFFLPIGLLAGPFVGAVVGELISGRTASESIRAGWGGLIGALSSLVVKVTVAIAMTVVFVVTVL
jgi:Uncharacterized protein conserved in bacteria